jgi:hypothetical protein
VARHLHCRSSARGPRVEPRAPCPRATTIRARVAP